MKDSAKVVNLVCGKVLVSAVAMVARLGQRKVAKKDICQVAYLVAS